MGIRVSDRVTFRGHTTTARGATAYQMLLDGRKHREIAEACGIAVSSVGVYRDRLINWGMMRHRYNLEPFVAVSETTGERHILRGERAIEAAGFHYSAAFEAAKHGKSYCGFTWSRGKE